MTGRVLLVTSEHEPLRGGVASLCRVIVDELASRQQWEVSVAAPPRSIFDCRVRGLPIVERVRSPWAVARALARTARALDRLEPSRFDRVIFLDAAARALSMLAPARWAGTSVYVHGTELTAATRSGEWIGRRVARQRVALCRASRVIANSAATRALVASAVGRADVEVLYPAFDPRRVAQRRRAPHDPPSEQLVLLTVARLVPRKGHATVLRSLARLNGRMPPWRYVVVGAGPQRAALGQLARALGLADHVEFAGAVPDDRLGDYYAAADLFVMLPEARSDGVEGFGLTYIEAAASGVASLASRHGGASEAVVDGVTGRTVDATASDRLDAALLELALDVELRQSLAAEARRRAWLELTPARFVSALVGDPPPHAIGEQRS